MQALANLPTWSLYVVPAFIFLITVVVFFHELGHFAVARYFNVKVETFSIGFGRGLVKWTDSKGTLWKIGWIPLGGFVKFLGDADGASTPDREAAANMAPADRAVAFPFKPVWQRALIVAAGPVANFILAFVILMGLFMFHGELVVPPIVGKIAPHSAAQIAGLHSGDRIVSVDGTAIESFIEYQQLVGVSTGIRMPMVVERGGRNLTLWVVPRETTMIDQFNNKQVVGDLGFDPQALPIVDTVTANMPAQAAGLRSGDLFQSINGRSVESFEDVQKIVSTSAGRSLAIVVKRGRQIVNLDATPVLKDKRGQLGFAFLIPQSTRRLGPIAAAGASVGEIRRIITTTFRALTSGPAAAKQVSGIIGISQVAGQAASLGFAALIDLAALLSVSIGLVNLFPIPLLDGGHLLYYACEGVLGRPLGERAQDVGFRLGLAVVLGIFLLATWNDLVRLNLF